MTTAREPYAREYWVVPGWVSVARRTEIYSKAAAQQKTVGPSFDDAGIGEGLSARIAVLWDVPVDRRGIYLDWFAKFYPGTIVRFDGALGGSPPTDPPTGSGRSPKLGLHSSASGHVTGFDQFDALQPEWIKIMSNQDIEGIATLARTHPAKFIVRVYLDFWENDQPRKVYPTQFYEWTRDPLREIFKVLKGHGRQFMVECHNEPNLLHEGHMYDGRNFPSDPGSWCAGHQFSDWMLTWRRYFQGEFGSDIPIITPGLSPGGHIANFRADSRQFYRELSPIINVCGRMGIHCYWSDEAPLSLALAELNDVRAMYPNAKKYITEFSHNKLGDFDKKAREIASFARAVEKMSDVECAIAFVADDPHGLYPFEDWDAQGMAQRVRAILQY